MKQISGLMILGLIIVIMMSGCISKYFEEQKAKERLEISKGLFQEFSMMLKGELQKAIREGGPASAIGVCKKVSLEAEETFSAKYPDIIKVRRISLKTRNPERHTPSDDEVEYLQWAEKTWTADPDQVSQVKISLSDSSSTKIFFPISVGDPMCILCHGQPEQIIPEIQNALTEHYPQDQAVGYQVGDFRGAFVVEWKN
ncbi:MAG: Tll0287-like domain-containing protein [Candidatus Hinthialibacter sp.]